MSQTTPQKQKENILTLSSKEAFKKVINFVGAVRLTADDFGTMLSDLIFSCGAEYQERTDALESDLRYIQPIPYIALQTPDRSKVLHYVRHGGGEARLNKRMSIGFGGHVNDNDKTAATPYPQDIWAGAERELSEKDEVGLLPSDYTSLEPYGACYIPTDPENVHFGLFMIATLNASGMVKLSESFKANTKPENVRAFLNYTELHAMRENASTEAWSRYFIQLLLQERQ